MHDLDRTFEELEGSFEAESEGEGGFGAGGGGGFAHDGGGGVLGEDEVQELASELLSVSNDQELNYFLTDLIKKAGSALGSAVKATVGQPLGGILKSVAQKVLPVAGAAIGNMIVPGVGGAIGGKLASTAGSLLGLELEGLSQEDRELEAAKQFVRFGAEATGQAAQAVQQGHAPHEAVRDALVQAAQRYAPGLLEPQGPGGWSTAEGAPACTCRHGHGHHHHHGRWERRGHHIVLFGI